MTGLLWWLPLAFVVSCWLGLEIADRRSRRAQPQMLMLPAVVLECGCLRISESLLVPCAVHDPAAEPPVEQWAAETEDL